MDIGHEPKKWSWSWLKEWTGYIVTTLPYISSALVLAPLHLATKLLILGIFAVCVLTTRVLHERAGIEVTSRHELDKKPETMRG